MEKYLNLFDEDERGSFHSQKPGKQRVEEPRGRKRGAATYQKPPTKPKPGPSRRKQVDNSTDDEVLSLSSDIEAYSPPPVAKKAKTTAKFAEAKEYVARRSSYIRMFS